MADQLSSFVDLQVNGYAGVDFNAAQLEEEQLHHACERLRQDGTDRILLTIITDDVDRITAKLKQIVAMRRRNSLLQEVIAGFHIEGPFINEQPGYVGAHPVEHARSADVSAMQQMLDAADGLTRIVTLAPERDPSLEVTRLLSRQGICVAAGHCDPSLDELAAALDAGLNMFTHLGNGCPKMMDRHDNIIQRVLSLADRLWISLIADGVHLPWPAFGNYLRCAGIDRCVVVSDAINAAGLGPGTFTIGDQQVVVDEHGATWSADRSHLMGSATTLQQMAERLQTNLGLSQQEISRLTSENPGRILEG